MSILSPENIFLVIGVWGSIPFFVALWGSWIISDTTGRDLSGIMFTSLIFLATFIGWWIWIETDSWIWVGIWAYFMIVPDLIAVVVGGRTLYRDEPTEEILKSFILGYTLIYPVSTTVSLLLDSYYGPATYVLYLTMYAFVAPAVGYRLR